ncbi:Protein EARLY FLOWERING 3 [Striga hermonthica]|uniref:Protein EARLY FLOWERING 3 n=1 Tax=Striga hermonthica TaxID=68872 RepID=A0A9N7N4D9_STRHE|nr:Protein EARLY FLOWERING 3 [Striga hermonthica]
MKGGKNGEKTMGPLFPRIHLNDTDKGGPRAPPRNKMALYEQLSIPSHRFSRLSSNLNSSQGSVSDKGPYFSHPLPPENPHARQYAQHSDLSIPSPQVEQADKLDQDDFSVPIFTRPVSNKNQEKPSASSPTHNHHPLKSQTDKDTGTPEHNTSRESENKNGEIFENCSLLDDIAAGDLCNGPSRNVNLERGDSVSEDSVLDVVCEVNLTPDDVVGVIGQKHFWNARRAIVNQQRVFAVQVFELHRLIKVQRSIAAAPQLLIEDSAYVIKPAKPLPTKKRSLDNTLKSNQNEPIQKTEHEKAAHKNECSAENILEKKSSSQNRPLTNSSHSITKPCLNQAQGHHWLIPVMSPSEGLVYKPYPGPGFAGQPCNLPGASAMVSNFLGPPYGVPPLPQYHFSPFPHFGYYGMPVMNAGTGPHVPAYDPGVQPGAGQSNGPVSEGIGVQASTGSSPSEKQAGEGQNVLSLFPVGPSIGAGAPNSASQDSGPSRVIKVVPRNGVSASQHAARIFMLIQQERGQFDSV